ncbi:hypothetical protein CLERM_794 [Coxiella-like endosymbiont]|nr:hypothetical protein CLERM_794 [Coxiella-like endosymbiont]
MLTHISNKRVVASLSRALFNLDKSNEIYQKYGLDSYV